MRFQGARLLDSPPFLSVTVQEDEEEGFYPARVLCSVLMREVEGLGVGEAESTRSSEETINQKVFV